MSAKNNQQCNERRLRPIYELLDNGNNKKAIQEADKLLKKQAIPCAKALKALALLRLGKEAESLELLECLRKEKPTDEPTLQAMTHCYKDLNKCSLICELYEAARLAQPENEDTLVNLFTSYVRVSDYKKQFQTASLLIKLQKKPNHSNRRYLFWGVMSQLLQALPIEALNEYCYPPLCEYKPNRRRSEEKRDAAAMVSLRCAERMVYKMIDSNLVDNNFTSNEALLSLVVFEALGDYEKALKVLDLFDRDVISPDYYIKKKIDLLTNKADGDNKIRHTISELLEKQLLEEPDNWCLIQYYIEYSLDSHKTMKFIDTLIEKNLDCKKRGPYLAHLEFYKELRSKNQPTNGLYSDLVFLMLHYFKDFGHLDCCTRDLAPYLPLLSSSEVKNLLHLIWKYVDLNKGDYPADRLQMSKHLNNLEMARASGIFDSMSVEENVTLASSLVNYFMHSQDFNDNIPATESRSSDRYMLLAVHVLYDLWLETKDSNYVFEAVVVCHFGLKFSPSNRQLKLLLVKLYHILGAVIPAHTAFKELDIKHMQIDSIGYLHLWPARFCGDTTVLTPLFNSFLKFYTTNYKDSSDPISFAYKFESYIKIPDFITIKEILNNSVMHWLVKLEQRLFHITMSPVWSPVFVNKVLTECDNSWANFGEFDWSKVCDNRDFNVLWDMGGVSKRTTQEDINQSFSHEMLLLRIRMIMMKVIRIVTNINMNHINQPSSKETPTQVKGDSGEDTSGYESGTSDNSKTVLLYEVKASLSSLKELKTELSDIVSSFKERPPSAIPQRGISSPYRSRLVSLNQLSYFNLILYQTNLLYCLLKSGDECDPEEVQHFLNCVCVYYNEFSKLMSTFMNADDPVFRKNVLQVSTIYLELVSFSLIIHGTLHSIFKQTKPNSGKKGKKKKDTPPPSPLEENENAWKEEIVKDLKKNLLDNTIKVYSLLLEEEKLWLSKDAKIGLISSITLDNEDHHQSLLNLVHEISESIKSSHINTISLLLPLFTERIKYLSS